MNDKDKIEELLERINSKLFWVVFILALIAVAVLTSLPAHAATIAYGTTPAMASEITEDLKGLPDTGYTYETSNGDFMAMGMLCDGVTWIDDKIIVVNVYQPRASLDYTILYETEHALRGDANEPAAEAFATKMMAERGEAVTPWTVTAEQQAVEDQWNRSANK